VSMTESTNDEVQLSEQDVADLAKIGIDASDEEAAKPQRTLLTAWRHVFGNVAKSRAEKVPLMAASRIVASWPKLSFQDTAVYHDLYHSYLTAIGDFLDDVRPAAFDLIGDADGVDNREDYVALLVEWHIYLDFLKNSWNASDPESHIQAAALVDAGEFVFSQTGLLGHLGAIGFQLDEQVFMQRVHDEQEKRGEQ